MGSMDNLLDGGLRTIELCPGMVVTPVYLEEWSSTVEVYMPDEHEAPPWRYTDMLGLCWLGVFLSSVGLMLVNAGFIVLGVGFESLPSVSVIVMLVVFIVVGMVCLVSSCVSYHRCHRVYHQYLHSTTPTPAPFEDRAALPQQPAIWQLL
ncbi:hypothetical protein Pmani_031015 [Petrolisthes manimaculis]|uniref:Uncharacterized protein n=1 Tax=Petrolisthes manimaculis TaxID=1843537 RepID=A0AAE1TT17_9EUCA|nr:hypothetical protein Pmani_031015 [Petrolisthes manimaculis]